MDDESYIREAIDLARESVENGNTPFGSLLVRDGEVIRRSRNTTVTEEDITAHPELKLARWAARELDAEARAETTMYTSTEPCEMCATAIHYAGLGRVVFSVATGTLAELRGSELGYTCAELVDAKGGTTTVEGPVLEAEGLAVHEN
jgi:tRNA(Arg) A34 adenosine deaminase TadA